MFAPAKTPPAAIARLQREIAQALPELKPRFEQNGGDVIELAPERLKPFVASEYDKWIKIIQDAGIRLDCPLAEGGPDLARRPLNFAPNGFLLVALKESKVAARRDR